MIRVKGLAAAFNKVVQAREAEVLLPGAFTRTIKSQPSGIVVAWQHQFDEPIGLAKVHESTRGLEFDATISDTQRGLDAQKLIRMGMNSVSIGFIPTETEHEKTKDGEMIRLIKSVELFEFSFVSRGADSHALIESFDVLPAEDGAIPQQQQAPAARNARSEMAEMFIRMSKDYIFSDPHRSLLCVQNAERVIAGKSPIAIH